MWKEFYIILIGIISGGAGYLLVTFWMKPIVQYREIRREIFSDLIFYANAINAHGMNDEMQERVRARSEKTRRHSAELTSNYDILPTWYRYWLLKRNERTLDAASQLIGLSNTLEHDDATQRINNIKEYLKIETNFV